VILLGGDSKEKALLLLKAGAKGFFHSMLMQVNLQRIE
jgi:hypothetical protein